MNTEDEDDDSSEYRQRDKLLAKARRAKLSIRAYNCAESICEETGMSHDELKKAISLKLMKPSRWRNVGVKTAQELAAWASGAKCPSCGRPYEAAALTSANTTATVPTCEPSH